MIHWKGRSSLFSDCQGRFDGQPFLSALFVRMYHASTICIWFAEDWSDLCVSETQLMLYDAASRWAICPWSRRSNLVTYRL